MTQGPLPKRVVICSSLAGAHREETVDVPAEIATAEELEAWASDLAAEMAEAGWYPAEKQDAP